MKKSPLESEHNQLLARFALFLLFLASVGGLSIPRSDGQSSSSSSQSVMTASDLEQGYAEFDLTSPFAVFGRGKFQKIFINAVGALSFGAPLLTDVLRKTRNDIIAFSPLLIDTKQRVDLSVSFGLLDATLREQVRESLSSAMQDKDIVVQHAFAAKFNYTFYNDTTNELQRNVFEITIANGNDDTYVHFDYQSADVYSHQLRYARAGQFAVRDGAIECSLEVEGSATEAMKNLATSSNVGIAGSFYWRVDLPLECHKFRSDCGRTKEDPKSYDLCPAGSFFETLSDTNWRFYKFYFCNAGRTRPDGKVTVKQECRYDPDYYSYEWRALLDSDKCTKRIKGFWNNYHETSSNS